MIEKNNLLLKVCNIAIKAGEEILKYYTKDIHVTHKDDTPEEHFLQRSWYHIFTPLKI